MNIYMNHIIRLWRQNFHAGIPLSRNSHLNTLLFADDQIIIAKTEFELQCAMHNLENTVSKFDMTISTQKMKVMAFFRHRTNSE